MLKNIKTYAFMLLAISIFSCSNDNEVAPLFEENISTRVQAQLDNYNEILKNSEFGWKTTYQPEDNIGAFNIHLKFNDDNTVTITSDYNNGDDDLATTYRVGIAHFPELILENYSIFHKLFETAGFTLGAEFEFLFDEITDDVITFRSKTDIGEKSTIIFTKATIADLEQTANLQGLDERLVDGYLTDLPFRGMAVTNTQGDELLSSAFTFNNLTRTATIAYEEEGGSISQVYPIMVTEAGFDFVTPITVSGIAFQSFIYDESANHFISIVSDHTAIISHASLPLYINNDILEVGSIPFTDFLYRPSLGADPRTTVGFNTIISQIDTDMDAFGYSFFDFSQVIDIDGADGSSYTQIVLINDSSGSALTIYYDMRPSIQDKKLFFEYIGPFDDGTDDAQSLESIMQPLLDFWLNTEGLIYNTTGTFQNFSNPAGIFISAQDPSLSVYGPWL